MHARAPSTISSCSRASRRYRCAVSAIAATDWAAIVQIGQYLKRIALLAGNQKVFTDTVEKLFVQAELFQDSQNQILILLEWASQKTISALNTERDTIDIDSLINRAENIFLKHNKRLPSFIGARILLTTAQIHESRSNINYAKKLYRKILQTYKRDAGSFSTYIRAALNLGRIDVIENRVAIGSEKIAFAYQGAKKLGDWHLFSSAIQACLDCATDSDEHHWSTATV